VTTRRSKPQAKSQARTDNDTAIYFLPNLFTTLNLFCGFYAIIASLQDFYLRAAYAIMVAGVFDILDGRIARLTKRSSAFGKELDSLTDLVSFGLAPVILMYLWSIESFGRIGWLACFVYIACGALRLARFNTRPTSERKYFEGLPIPMAAAVIVTTTLLFHELMLDEQRNYFNLGVTIVLAFLMVSNVRYRSFKDLDFRDRKSFRILVFVIFTLMVIAYNPGVMLFVFVMAYLISGPVSHFLGHTLGHLLGKKKHPSDKHKQTINAEPDASVQGLRLVEIDKKD